MYPSIFLFSVLLVLVNSDPTWNLEELRHEGLALIKRNLNHFKTKAENGKPLKNYTKKLKEYLAKAAEINLFFNIEVKKIVNTYKGIITGEVEQENIDWKRIEQMQEKPKEQVELINIILDSSLEWIEKRIEFVSEEKNKNTFNRINSSLNNCKNFFNAILDIVSLNELLLEYKSTPLAIKTDQVLLVFIPMIHEFLAINGPIDGSIVSSVINIIDKIE